MTPRRWTLVTLLLTLVAGAGGVLASMRVDPYGLFRDTHGRSLRIYDSERRAKYLLNRHYVPENFDAILLGSSVSDSWNTGTITAFRTYNESTDGGNITEQKLLAEQALIAPGIRLVICIVHPYLTHSHGPLTDELSDAEYWGALGSISLFRSYKPMLFGDATSDKTIWEATGFQDVEGPLELSPVLRGIMLPDGEFHVDEVAFEEYRALTTGLRERGITVVAVVPPTTDWLLAPRRAETDRYLGRMRSLFLPQELFIDFNGPEHAAFRADAANFRDGVHLSRRGAATVVRALDERLLERKASPPSSP